MRVKLVLLIAVIALLATLVGPSRAGELRFHFTLDACPSHPLVVPNLALVTLLDLWDRGEITDEEFAAYMPGARQIVEACKGVPA